MNEDRQLAERAAAAQRYRPARARAVEPSHGELPMRSAAGTNAALVVGMNGEHGSLL